MRILYGLARKLEQDLLMTTWTECLWLYTYLAQPNASPTVVSWVILRRSPLGTQITCANRNPESRDQKHLRLAQEILHKTLQLVRER